MEIAGNSIFHIQCCYWILGRLIYILFYFIFLLYNDAHYHLFRPYLRQRNGDFFLSDMVRNIKLFDFPFSFGFSIFLKSFKWQLVFFQILFILYLFLIWYFTSNRRIMNITSKKKKKKKRKKKKRKEKWSSLGFEHAFCIPYKIVWLSYKRMPWL